MSSPRVALANCCTGSAARGHYVRSRWATGDFPTFRAAMRATLTPDQFTAADDLYLATVAEAHSRLAPPLSGEGTGSGTQPDNGRPQLDRDRLEAAVAGYLHTLIGRSATAGELTVRVRAAQTAAFHLGWLLQVNLERLVATASAPSAVAARDRRTWHALRLYREPYIGAILVLTALGIDIATMLTLPAGDVAADGTAVTVHGAALPTPPGAAVLLRAQQISGRFGGRAPAQPFLHANGDPITENKMVSAVRAAYSDTGSRLLSRLVDHTWSGFEWFNRWGVSLQDVA